MINNYIKRHSASAMWEHWLTAISGIVLLLSGFGELPMYKRFNIALIPGFSWTADYNIQLTIHYIAAIIFIFAVTMHIVRNILMKNYEIIPRRGDMKESALIIKAMFTKSSEPPQGKFLAEQRIIYAVFGTVIILLIVTGMIKVVKNMGDIVLPHSLTYIVTITHTILTPVFLLLLIMHLAAFVIPANRPLFRSMFTGKVNREYAERRHELWHKND